MMRRAAILSLVVVALTTGARADGGSSVLWRETDPYGPGGHASFPVDHISGSVRVDIDDHVFGHVAATYELLNGYDVVESGSLCGEAAEVAIPQGARWLRIRPGGVLVEGCLPAASGGTITMSYSRPRATPYVRYFGKLQIARGADHRRMSIDGINFNQETTVTASGSGVTVRVAHVHDYGFETMMELIVSADQSAELGDRDLIVSNGEAMTATCHRCVHVNPVPTIVEISPAQGRRSRGTAVTIRGTNFAPGAWPSVPIAAADRMIWTGDVVVGSVIVVDATTITANFNVQPHAIPGPRTVLIGNPDGGVTSCSACFTVTAA